VPSTSEFDSRPVYSADGELFFQARESGADFVYRINEDGTGRRKVMPRPIERFQGVSPDGRWVIALAAVPDEDSTRAVLAYSTRDGSIRRICQGICWAVWSQDGTLFNLTLPDRATFAIPLRRGKEFPPIPSPGVKSLADLRTLKGVPAAAATDSMPRSGSTVYFVPHSTSYAFSRQTVRRNIYQIPIPR